MDEDKKPKIYEWVEEATKLPIPPKVEKPEKTYDEKLVAYIDVLGMTEKALGGSAEQLLTLMGNLRLCVGRECDPLTEHVKFLQLGDGFTIVADLNCINELCEALSRIQWHVLVYSQMMVRGALTAGPIGFDEEHEDIKYIVGPAFITAYRLETRNAIYPRIILASEIEPYMAQRSINISFNHIVEDNDKLKYLDFIGHSIDTGKYNKKTLDHLLTTEGTKGLLKSQYEKYLKDDKEVAQKYGWLIRRLAAHGIDVL